MSNERAPIVHTQNMEVPAVSVGMQRAMSEGDMSLPGEGEIQMAEGMVKQGSARIAAEIMDRITGDSNENRSADFKRSA